MGVDFLWQFRSLELGVGSCLLYGSSPIQDSSVQDGFHKVRGAGFPYPGIKIAQKPSIVSSLGAKALIYESLDPQG